MNLLKTLSLTLLALAFSLQSIHAEKNTRTLAVQSDLSLFSYLSPEQIQNLVDQEGEVAQLAIKYIEANGFSWPEKRDSNSPPRPGTYIQFDLEPYVDHDPFSGTSINRTRFTRARTWSKGEDTLIARLKKIAPTNLLYLHMCVVSMNG